MTATTETPRQTNVYSWFSKAREKNGRRFAYLFLILSITPILIGYSWLLIATFSVRTQGMLPRNAQGDIGGFTLDNWDFLGDGQIWTAMLNSFLIAMAMAIGVGIVSTAVLMPTLVNIWATASATLASLM